jgi:hypothetical protein
MEMPPRIQCTIPLCRMAFLQALLGLMTPALMRTWSKVLPAGHEVQVLRQVQLLLVVLLLLLVVLQLLEAALALPVLTVVQQVGPRRWLEGDNCSVMGLRVLQALILALLLAVCAPRRWQRAFKV